MSLKKRIIVNAGSNWATILVTAVAGLILVPIMLNGLGVSRYGVWALLATGLSYPLILESAFSLAINRFVAFYRNDATQINRFVATSFVILGVSAALTVAAAVLLSFFVADIFAAIPAELAGEAKITCILVGFTLALKMLTANFSGALRGFQYYTRYNLIAIITQVLRAALIVAAMALSNSIVILQSACVVAAAVSALLMYIMARRSIPGLSVDPRLLNRSTFNELMRYIYHSLARSGSSIVMYSTMTVLVGWRGTAAQVTIYKIASMIPGFVRGGLAATQGVFLPAVASLFAEGKIDRIKALTKRGTHMTAVVTCASAILLFVLAEDILNFWLRRTISSETVLVMRMMVISIIPGGVFEIWLPVLVGMGYLRALSIASIATAAGAILVAAVLVQGYVAVPMAPALALALALLAKAGLWLPLYSVRKLGIGYYEYFKEALSRSVMASIVSIALLWVFAGLLQDSVMHWSVKAVVATLVVSVSFGGVALSREVRDVLVSFARRNKA